MENLSPQSSISIAERLQQVKDERRAKEQHIKHGALTDEELKTLTPEQLALRHEANVPDSWHSNLSAISSQFRTAEVMVTFLDPKNEPTRGTLDHFRWQLGHVCEHWIFSMAIAALVLSNAVIMGLHADAKVNDNTFQLLLYLFLGMFTVEIVTKLFAFGPKLYFADSWNTFDFVVVSVSVLELIWSAVFNIESVASVTRLLRVFRVIRLVSSLKELEVILRAFVQSMSAVSWVAVLTVIMLYIFGVIATLSFGRSEDLAIAVPESQMFFGSVPRSMFTMLQIMTMEWVEPTRAVGEYYHASWPFFVGFLFFAGIGVLNLFTAIYVDRLQQLTKQQEIADEELKMVRREELELELMDMFEIIDADHSGTVDENELKTALQLLDSDAQNEEHSIDNTVLKAKLFEFGMSLETIVVALYKFGNRFKSNASAAGGEIEYKDFIHSVFTMHDPATRQDATEVNTRISHEIGKHRERLLRLEEKIVEANSLITQLLSSKHGSVPAPASKGKPVQSI